RPIVISTVLVAR
ncbi:unnamed protein product, partial [Allacma fusca]